MTAWTDEMPPPADDWADEPKNPRAEWAPPHDLDAERAVLGSMIFSKQAITDALQYIKTPDMYYRPLHGVIHDAIVHLYTAGEPVDRITVTDRLREIGELQRVGGPAYLTQVLELGTPASADYYAGIVADLYRRREALEATDRARQALASGQGDVDELIAAAQQEILALDNGAQEEGLIAVGVSMPETMDRVEEAGTKVEGITGLATGFTDLDSLTSGLQAGQMIVIAARPAMGKSTLALDLARACAIKQGLPAVFFSLEMGRHEINLRLLSAEAKVGLHRLRSGQMSEEDWARIARRMPDVSAAPLYVDDSPSLTMAQIQAKARRMRDEQGLGLVVIDYLQLLHAGGSQRFQSREQEVSHISRTTKLLAKELEVPVIALSQLNRGPEQRTDKKPMVSDLRESGSIEQDADMVILLHREDAYVKESGRAGEADLIVAKHRNGPTATVTVAFQGHYSRFIDMAMDV